MTITNNIITTTIMPTIVEGVEWDNKEIYEIRLGATVALLLELEEAPQ